MEIPACTAASQREEADYPLPFLVTFNSSQFAQRQFASLPFCLASTRRQKCGRLLRADRVIETQFAEGGLGFLDFLFGEAAFGRDFDGKL